MDMSGLAPEVGWVVLGLILVGFELGTGTFVMLFFAGGAFVTGLLTWIGLLNSIVAQLVVFGVFSGCGLLLFKEKLKTAWRRDSTERFQSDTGETVVVDKALGANGLAEVHYQGTTWTAVHESGRVLHAGERVAIVRVDGVKLIVK